MLLREPIGVLAMPPTARGPPPANPYATPFLAGGPPPPRAAPKLSPAVSAAKRPPQGVAAGAGVPAVGAAPRLTLPSEHPAALILGEALQKGGEALRSGGEALEKNLEKGRAALQRGASDVLRKAGAGGLEWAVMGRKGKTKDPAP